MKFKTEELNERSEWFFWSCLVNTKENLSYLKDIFEIDEYNWPLLKHYALFEILSREFGDAFMVLKEKLLTKSQIEASLTIEDSLNNTLHVYSTMIFSNYSASEIIGVLDEYCWIALQEKTTDELRQEMNEILISRLKKLFKLDSKENKSEEIQDALLVRFPYGWTIGLDAFTNIKIEQVREENIQIPKLFQKELDASKKKSEETLGNIT